MNRIAWIRYFTNISHTRPGENCELMDDAFIYQLLVDFRTPVYKRFTETEFKKIMDCDNIEIICALGSRNRFPFDLIIQYIRKYDCFPKILDKIIYMETGIENAGEKLRDPNCYFNRILKKLDILHSINYLLLEHDFRIYISFAHVLFTCIVKQLNINSDYSYESRSNSFVFDINVCWKRRKIYYNIGNEPLLEFKTYYDQFPPIYNRAWVFISYFEKLIEQKGPKYFNTMFFKTRNEEATEIFNSIKQQVNFLRFCDGLNDDALMQICDKMVAE